MTDDSPSVMDKINIDLVSIVKAMIEKGVPINVPNIFNWLDVHVYNEPPGLNLHKCLLTNDAYKGLRCPLVPVGTTAGKGKEGLVTDLKNQYFTEDISLGRCRCKDPADISEVKIPTIDHINE